MKKVESLKKLNKLVQKPDYKKVGNWMARHITRDMALPLTWILLHTSISANGVTLISLIVALMGNFLFSFGTRIYFLWGVILLQLWYLLDHVDGQIARYRKQISITGIFFDYLTHHIIHITVFIGIGWGVYAHTSKSIYILSGIISAISILILNLIYDSQYKAFFHYIKRYPCQIGDERQKNVSTAIAKSNQFKSKFQSKLRVLFSWMHKLCEIHVLMNIITVLVIIQFLIDYYLWKTVIIFYTILTSIVAILKLMYFILKYKPDKEFQEISKIIF